MCSELLRKVNLLNLPRVKPIWVDLTDAGPGVGVSNNEVKFRDAELARIHRSEYRCVALFHHLEDFISSHFYYLLNLHFYLILNTSEYESTGVVRTVVRTRPSALTQRLVMALWMEVLSDGSISQSSMDSVMMK